MALPTWPVLSTGRGLKTSIKTDIPKNEFPGQGPRLPGSKGGTDFIVYILSLYPNASSFREWCAFFFFIFPPLTSALCFRMLSGPKTNYWLKSSDNIGTATLA